MIKSFKSSIHKIILLLGYELTKTRTNESSYQNGSNRIDTRGLSKIQYGCGINLLKGWANVDSLPLKVLSTWRNEQIPNGDQSPVEHFFYKSLDLTHHQPFDDNSFNFGFCEDFIEHLTQAESIIFLSECYRVLRPGGILRMSFPGLEGVLKNHYFPPTGYQSASDAKKDCYDQWEHIHFYSRDELHLVATHLGYSEVKFSSYGESDHTELKGLETRVHQQNVNTYVELVK
jgi:predicted SAM-dependent methyltransferase